MLGFFLGAVTMLVGVFSGVVLSQVIGRGKDS